MKEYKTYQARNAVKAALVTNHIIAQKKLGVSHSEAKAEAYRLYNIKAGLPILRKHFSVYENKSPVITLPALPNSFATAADLAKLPPLPKPPTISLPPLPKVGV